MIELLKKVCKILGLRSEDKQSELLMFYSMVGVEMIAMFAIMTLQIVMGYNTKSIVPLFLSVAYLGVMIGLVTKYSHRMMLFKALTFVPMLFGIIPYLFMGTEGGGIKSGMPIWMVLGLLLIFLFTRGIYFWVLLPLTLLVYIGCMIYSYRYLQDKLGQLDELYYYQDNIMAIVAVSLSCGLIFKYQQRYEERTKKKIEEEKQNAQKANEAKSKFLANMSHDIRTPMNAILGMTEMANRNIEDKEKVQECLKKINDSSMMLLHLINNVLDMSEIENQELRLKEMKFDMKEVVKEIYNVLEHHAMASRLDFEVQYGELHDVRLVGDVVRFRQVLMNLLSNSIKFTPAGGKVSLCIKQREELEDSKREGYATFEIEIRDTGIGMKQEFIDSMIFRRFERDEAQYVSKTEGNGIGMSITKSILDVMGADLQIESEVGKGSTFRFVVQLKKDQDVKKEEWKEKNEVPMIRDKRILVVEDNEINMEIILAILEDTQAEIIHVWNAEEAIEVFKNSVEGFFDLVLMDVQLPGMSGYEATEQIRNIEEGREYKVPVFAMTANAFAQDIERSKKCGMNEHISKPIDIEELYQKIREYLVNVK